MPRQRFVMGNWKMNGTAQTVDSLLAHIKSIPVENDFNTVIFPPFVYLERASKALNNSALQLGAQTVSQYDNGAYTGEISISMLKELGCEYVLIGHSERRQYFYETPEMILQKFLQVTQAGLRPVLCVGETLQEYQAQQTQSKILNQLEAVLKSSIALQYLPLMIIAYEPVWAIGTGLSATPEQAQAVHRFIRGFVPQETPILYGGSVKATNAAALFAMEDIDGALVGGASLIGEEFQAICQAMLDNRGVN